MGIVTHNVCYRCTLNPLKPFFFTPCGIIVKQKATSGQWFAMEWTRHRYCGMVASVLAARSARRHQYNPFHWLHVSGCCHRFWRRKAPSSTAGIIFERAIQIWYQMGMDSPARAPLFVMYIEYLRDWITTIHDIRADHPMHYTQTHTDIYIYRTNTCLTFGQEVVSDDDPYFKIAVDYVILKQQINRKWDDPADWT